MQINTRNKGWLTLLVAAALTGTTKEDVYISMITSNNPTWRFEKVENDFYIFKCVILEQIHRVHKDDLINSAFMSD